MKTYQESQYTPTARASFAGAKNDRPTAKRETLTATEQREQARQSRPDIQRMLTALGFAVARKRADRDGRAIGRERELAEVATSAASLALAVFIDRADRLGVTDAREYLGFMPARGRFARSVYVAAYRAADVALRKMSKSDLVETSFFSSFAVETPESVSRNPWSAPEHASVSDAYPVGEYAPDTFSPDLLAKLVKDRCETVRARIRERVAGTRSNRVLGASKRHLATVDRCEAVALASISGETFALADCARFAADVIGHGTERLTVRKSGRITSGDGRGAVTGTRKHALRADVAQANSLAWQRCKALADFVGVPYSASVNGFALLF